MKDYNLFLDLNGKDEIRRKYILRYEIQEEEITNKKNIIIYFADGKKHSLPYTLYTEKQILQKMKEQFNEYKLDMFLWKKGKNFSVNFINGMVKITTFMLLIGITLLISSSHPLALGIGLVFGIIGGGLSLFSWPLKIIANSQMNDYEKHMLFLENEEFINNSLKQSTTILANINDKISDKTSINEEGNKICIINSIDKMSLSELKELLNVIRREKSLFEKESKNETKQEKKLKLVKKIKGLNK